MVTLPGKKIEKNWLLEYFIILLLLKPSQIVLAVPECTVTYFFTVRSNQSFVIFCVIILINLINVSSLFHPTDNPFFRGLFSRVSYFGFKATQQLKTRLPARYILNGCSLPVGCPLHLWHVQQQEYLRMLPGQVPPPPSKFSPGDNWQLCRGRLTLHQFQTTGLVQRPPRS